MLTPDRLARKYAYQVLLLEEFRRAGCEVVFLHHPISDDPSDQLLLQIQGAIAEYERAVLGERFRRGKLQRARAGQYHRRPTRPTATATCRAGTACPATWSIDEAEAEIVRMLYGWLVEERTDHPPDPQAPQLRPVVSALAAGSPGRPRRCTTSSPTRSTPARPTPTATAIVPPKKPRRPRGPRTGEATAASQAARAVDRHPGAGADRPGDLGPGAGAARAQRRALVPQQHAAQLPAALPADLRVLWPGHVRRQPSARRGSRQRRYYRCRGKDCILTRPRPAPARAAASRPRRSRPRSGTTSPACSGDPRAAAGPIRATCRRGRGGSARGAGRRAAARAPGWSGSARAESVCSTPTRPGSISLAELSERRRQLAEQRRALERQQREQARAYASSALEAAGGA